MKSNNITFLAVLIASAAFATNVAPAADAYKGVECPETRDANGDPVEQWSTCNGKRQVSFCDFVQGTQAAEQDNTSTGKAGQGPCSFYKDCAGKNISCAGPKFGGAGAGE